MGNAVSNVMNESLPRPPEKDASMENNPRKRAGHFLIPITRDTTGLELTVMGWFAAGHDVLWIPIYEVGDGPESIADAEAKAVRLGGPRLIHDVTDYYRLPLGIKGWLFPAHLDDTDVVCAHDTLGDVSFGYLQHPRTGKRLTWRYPTEAPILRRMFYSRLKRG
jgi:hypothetical protein